MREHGVGTGGGARRPRLRRWAAVLALTGLAAACAEGGRTEYEQDGDTGAASPNASPDMNTAKMNGPDSTLGVGGRTGEPGIAGDTVGARGISPDSVARGATRAAADSMAARGGRPPE